MVMYEAKQGSPRCILRLFGQSFPKTGPEAQMDNCLTVPISMVIIPCETKGFGTVKKRSDHGRR